VGMMGISTIVSFQIPFDSLLTVIKHEQYLIPIENNAQSTISNPHFKHISLIPILMLSFNPLFGLSASSFTNKIPSILTPLSQDQSNVEICLPACGTRRIRGDSKAGVHTGKRKAPPPLFTSVSVCIPHAVTRSVALSLP
jgi:hypothetical protein